MGLTDILGKKIGEGLKGLASGLAPDILKTARNVAADKLQDSDSAALQTIGEVLESPEMKQKVEEAIASHEELVRAYEGDIKDLTEWGKNIRASVRPILTYVVVALYLVFLFSVLVPVYWLTVVPLLEPGITVKTFEPLFAVLKAFWFIHIVVMIVGWWFLDRGIQHWIGKFRGL